MRVVDLGTLSANGNVGDFNLSEVVDGYSAQMMAVQFILTGDPLTCTVDMEGSLDNTNWFSLDAHVVSAGELSALGGMYHVVDKPVKYLRAAVSNFTHTTSGTIILSVFAGK